MSTALQYATYADLFDLPEHLIGEILHGQIYTQPRPAPRHAVAASVLGSEIGHSFQSRRHGPGGWWILLEPELHLGQHILVPDLAGWRRQRMPQLPDTAWFSLVPDWICEILSPSTAKVDRRLKMPLYASLLVNHLWLVDPLLRTLEVYQRQQQQWLHLETFSDSDRIAAPPFEAVSFDLAAVWGEESPTE